MGTNTKTEKKQNIDLKHGTMAIRNQNEHTITIIKFTHRKGGNTTKLQKQIKHPKQTPQIKPNQQNTSQTQAQT